MPPFIYDIATTVTTRVLAMVGPLAVSVVTARILGPEERGRFFLILSIAQIGAQIGNLGLQSSNTYLVANRHELVAPLVANSLLVSITAAPLVTLLIALAYGWPELLGLGSVLGAPLGSIAIAAVLIAPLMVMSLYINNLAIGIGRVQLFNGLTLAYSLAAIAAALIVASAGGSVLYFLFGTAISLALPTFTGAHLLLRGYASKFRVDVDLFRRGTAFAVKSYLATMFSFLMMRVGFFALYQRGSVEEVGQFSVAVQLAEGLTMLPSTVGILLFPMLMRAEKHQRRPIMWRAMWGLGAMMLAILGIVGILVPWLIPLLFGQAFTRAVVLTQCMLPPILIISLISVLSQYLAAEGFPRIQVLAWLLGLIAQTALSYWLAEKWGGVGVSVATSASSSLVFCLLLFETLSRKRAGIR